MEFKLLHVGINTQGPEEAAEVAGKFSDVFGFEKLENPVSVFAGTTIEVMKKPYLGKNGHIGYGVTDMDAAIREIREKGLEPDMETAVYDDNHELVLVYLKGEIGGFAIHFKRI